MQALTRGPTDARARLVGINYDATNNNNYNNEACTGQSTLYNLSRVVLIPFFGIRFPVGNDRMLLVVDHTGKK